MLSSKRTIGRVRSPDGTKEAVLADNCRSLVEVRPIGKEPPRCRYCDHIAGVVALAWSPNSTRIATADEGHHVHVWDATSGQKIGGYRQVGGIVNALTWATRGDSLAVAASDAVVYVLGTAQASLQAVFREHEAPVLMVAFSPDGELLASGSSDGAVCIWPVHGGVALASYLLRTSFALALSWSPAGQCVAALSDDSSVHVLEARTGTSHSWTIQPPSCKDLFWSPGGARLYLTGEGEVRCFDPWVGRELLRVDAAAAE